MIVIRTLGNAQIDVGDTHILPTSPRKFALVLYLGAEQNRPVLRSTLRELIFPEMTEKNALHSLRELVYQLRQADVDILSDGESLSLSPSSFSSDFDAFLRSERPTIDQVRSVEGGFLPGYAPNISDALSEWVEGYRSRSTFDLCKALIAEIVRTRTVGDWTRVERAARACLSLDRYNEEATFALAESLAIGGAKARAVELLDRYIVEVGGRSRDLRLPASVLRRRIGERPPMYMGSLNSPFVGRENEMRRIHERFAYVRGGRSQCVAILGEPGIGKSRLATEFCNVASLDGAMVAATSPQPHDIHRPFGAFADLQPKLLALPGALGISPESMRLLDRVVTSPTSDPVSFADAVRDSEALGHAITRAIIDLVDAIASEGPLILAIEDLPWLDTMSRRLLGYLLSTRQSRQLFIVVTSRDATPLAELSGDELTTIELRGVDAAAMRELTTTFVQRESLDFDADMQQWVQEASAGNPLFLESMLAHYASTRERFTVPLTMSNLLRRRVECLSERAIVALQSVSVLGKYATLEAVVDATALPRYELSLGIGELERARLIISDGQNLRPTHGLIADVAEQRLRPIERMLSHQYAAQALESRLLSDHSAAVVWECAEHWMAAGNPDRALSAIRRCANHAVEIGRAEEAAEILGRALDLKVSREERISIARQLVSTADAVASSVLVGRGTEVLRAENELKAHDELEFAEFRARTRVYYDNADQARGLFACLAAEEAGADHRISAALQLLKYAEVTFDSELTTQTIASVPESVLEKSTPLIQLEFRMLRALFSRRFPEAAESAYKLRAEAKAAPLVTRLRGLMNSTIAFYHCGLIDEAVTTASQCYDDAVTAGAVQFKLNAATFLADHYFDISQDEVSGIWSKRVEELLGANPSAAQQFFPALSRLGRALALNDLALATEIFNELDAKGLLAGGVMRARWRRACVIRMTQLELGRSPDGTELDELKSDAMQWTTVGGVGDLEVATLCHSFLLSGQVERAATLIEEYSTVHRASMCPISRMLVEAKGQIDARRALHDRVGPTGDHVGASSGEEKNKSRRKRRRA